MRKHIERDMIFQKFQEAAEAVKTLTKRPTDNEFLELYALYKQATVGDVNTCTLLFRCILKIKRNML